MSTQPKESTIVDPSIHLSGNQVTTTAKPADQVKDIVKNTTQPQPIDKKTQEKIDAEAQRQEDVNNLTRQQVQKTTTSVSGSIQGFFSNIQNWKTPVGLGVLFVILVVLIWIIVKVQGTGLTRMQLLWQTILGQTQLQPVSASTGNTNVYTPPVPGGPTGGDETVIQPLNIDLSGISLDDL